VGFLEFALEKREFFRSAMPIPLQKLSKWITGIQDFVVNPLQMY
jgi:hypothetical protein